MVNSIRQLDKANSELDVLFISSYDSSNYAYVEVIRELERRGHRWTVVGSSNDTVNNHMFADAGMPLIDVSHYAPRRLEEVDFVFAGPFVRREHRRLLSAVRKRGKFILSFANLFSSATMRVWPDLVLAANERKFEEFADNGLSYNMVALGNPQYDSLISSRSSRRLRDSPEIRSVLVADQGAYPLGAKGKRQLADTIRSMAANNPNMRFDVKPRYVPEDTGAQLHIVSEHLFSYLTDDLPENLTLLRTPAALETLLPAYDAMVTTWSTAHLQAIALGLPLVLIGGLDSVDVYDVRHQRVEAAYARLRETGCVVDWHDIKDQSCIFRRATDEYAHEELFDPCSPASPKVVDLLELIEDRLLREGKVFKEHFALQFRDFVEQLPSLSVTDLRSSSEIKYRRRAQMLNDTLQDLVFDNRCMGFGLDMRSALPLWTRIRDSEAATGRSSALSLELSRFARDLKAAYFEANPDEVANDHFIQDQYFDWLSENGRYAELWDRECAVVPESLEFNRGIAYLRRGRLFKAVRHVVESFSLSLTKPHRELRKDRTIRVLLAHPDRNLLAHAVLVAMLVYGKKEGLAVMEVPPRAGMDAIIYFKSRALWSLGRDVEAFEVCHDYFERFPGLPKHQGGAAGPFLGTLGRIYRYQIRRRLRVSSRL